MDFDVLRSLPPNMRPPEAEQVRFLGLSEAVFGPLRADAETRGEDVPPLRAYLLLDASADDDISVMLNGFSNPALCLFDGAAGEDLESVAPWLVELYAQEDSVWDWFVAEGFGKDWGIIIHSRLAPRRLKTQLKKFIMVEDEEGQKLYFKYYRPSTLNGFLPVFTPEQRVSFGRGIVAFLAESLGQGNTLRLHRVRPGGEHDVSEMTADEMCPVTLEQVYAGNDNSLWRPDGIKSEKGAARLDEGSS